MTAWACPPTKTVWISEVPDPITSLQIREALEGQQWQVHRVSIGRNGHGCAVFKDEQDAQSAVSHAHLHLGTHVLKMGPWIPKWKPLQVTDIVAAAPTKPRSIQVQRPLIVALRKVQPLPVGRVTAVTATDGPEDSDTCSTTSCVASLKSIPDGSPSVRSRSDPGEDALPQQVQVLSAGAGDAAEHSVQSGGADAKPTWEEMQALLHRQESELLRLSAEKHAVSAVAMQIQAALLKRCHELEDRLRETERREDQRASAAVIEAVKKQALMEQLGTMTEKLSTIQKDLAELCTCPLSFQLMREPVLGTDLRTYQKDAIKQSLEIKPASPFTRAFMDKGSLRPNMLARDLLDIVAKHFPDLEADGTLRTARSPPVDEELINALHRKDSDQAVELLGRDVNPNALNTCYIMDNERMTLLQLCIRLNLPQVAIAVIKRPEFRRVETYSNQGILAIHLAAAFNFADVCSCIIDDVGGYALQARTLRDVRLVDHQGHTRTIPLGSDARDCARLFGHNPEWADS